jgi:Flp pilus assembly protein CpaB
VAKLHGQVAKADILPGQQLTAKDFEAAGNGVITKLAATERAVAIPLDSAHGLLGILRAGDHVDVLSGFLVETAGTRPRPLLRTIAQDVLVLKAPVRDKAGAGLQGTANSVEDIVVRMSNSAAPKVAFAAEYGKVWLALRPADGKDVPRRSIVTIESLMFTDLANARVLRAGGGAR